MKTFQYSYESLTVYFEPVTEHSFLLRAVPAASQWQQLEKSELNVFPFTDKVLSGTDCWGSRLNYGIIREPHRSFGYQSKGIITVSEGPMPDSAPNPVFSINTGLTMFSPEMGLLLSGSGNLASALEMATNIKSHLMYVCGSTGVLTTAFESFFQRKGVCQDFTHILISLCRHAGIPARYVCGFVVGEGQTHAWAEVWSDGAWFGIDPTAGRLCDDTYIKVAVGRDARDCSVCRGVFYGTSGQNTTVKVIVQEI